MRRVWADTLESPGIQDERVRRSEKTEDPGVTGSPTPGLSFPICTLSHFLLSQTVGSGNCGGSGAAKAARILGVGHGLPTFRAALFLLAARLGARQSISPSVHCHVCRHSDNSSSLFTSEDFCEDSMKYADQCLAEVKGENCCCS